MSYGYIIEFFGPPGVGKSLIAAELSYQYKLHGSTVSEPTYRLTHDVDRWKSHVEKAPKIVSSLLDSQIISPKGDLIKKPLGTIRATYNWLFIVDLLREADQNEITILDQGLAQAAWSFAYMAGNHDYKKTILKPSEYLCTGQDHLFVFVTAPLDTIARRLNDRDSEGEPGDLAVDQTNLATAIDLCEEINHHLHSISDSCESTQMIRIENGNNSNPKLLAQDLYQTIKNRVSN